MIPFIRSRSPRAAWRLPTPVFLFVPWILLLLLGFATEPAGALTISDAIRSLLGDGAPPRTLFVACQKIHANRDLIHFYAHRNHQPAWVRPAGAGPLVAPMVQVLADSRDHGLNPEDYHLSCIRALLESVEEASRRQRPLSPRLLASLDVVLSDAFMILCSHLATGRVNPERLYPQWLSARHKADIIQGLNDLMVHGDVARTVRHFAPPHQDYWRLLAAARRQRAHLWSRVPPGPTLHPGDRDPRVVALRRRLAASGDLPDPSSPDPALFDLDLAAAVRRFQARHGLETDALVGRRTLEALNVSAEERLHQMLINLERWRWLPRRWGDRSILVNTADFSLTAYEKGRPALTMRVIVGETATKTPVFSRDMRYLEINPYWNVPRSIATKELLPKIRKDPDYLQRNHFELVTGWSQDSPVVDPATIDWSRVSPATFPGRLRQKPGPWNALGRIKFMFPNRFNVYLHDTPNRHLFQRPHRALSHGCIRVEKPLDLALFVLQDDPSWTRRRIQELIATGQRHVVPLARPCRVHLVYLTAWVDEQGTVHFRKDIYDRDRVLMEALGWVPSPTNSGPAPHPGG
ncbi:Murein L,D-transpeptidase YcbB/YkuD [Desulfacinum hydrothermale DSM 13146]|uniref:Murein L,D-transpeptidase YcbB/YkuD n=1 Tax=Desulfacinum hydrothermale DSM 13146 TaxID=1121390 RepID=A0A1W1WZE8_9BACT|nr:L,D-transpeptidase family protein [Desulfacinum hydrothermale]SMC16828.1 Murein L,D-transpeptidase YcbB/YkuD [Desulfacinum hydrothermale DSM 13146]